MKNLLTFCCLFLMVLPIFASEDSLFRMPFSQVPAKDDSGRKLMQDAIFELFHRYTNAQQQYNLIFWGSRIKGGGGFIQNAQGSTYYGGIFAHPQVNFGEITLASHFVSDGKNSEYELKAEYRLLNGLSFGGGYISDSYAQQKLGFAKISWHRNLEDWNFIVSGQSLQINEKNYMGGYGAVFNANTMMAMGYDGEELRATIGYIAPQQKRSPIRPAAEIFWIDRSLGTEIGGSNFLLAMATLGYKGGILSHPARLGRAMGPWGLEYSNPITFKTPTWNRLLNTWEQGGLANFRLSYSGISPKNYTWRTEVSSFPFQFFDVSRYLKGCFVGAYHLAVPTQQSVGSSAGWSHVFKYFGLMSAAEYDFQSQQYTLFFALSHHF